MNTITLIGCGAVGALYGLRFHNFLGEKQVCFLVDEQRKARYEREGIFLNGTKAPFRYATSQEAEVSDLVILATKNHHLQDAIELMRPVVGEQTVILSLLNGIESERILSSVFGEEKVLYSFAVGLNATHAGNAISYTEEGHIVFGEKDNRRSERVESIISLFDRAGIACVVPQDIHRELWNKFMLNTAYNTISSLLGASYGELAQDSVWTLTQQVCKEVQAIAKAEGVDLPDSLVVQNHKVVTSLGFAGKTSMCQDMLAGRPTENPWFCGTVIKLGIQHGIPTPTCEVLSLLVESRQAINRMRAQVR
jgi:2-dehydropantoate 2-reductase